MEEDTIESLYIEAKTCTGKCDPSKSFSDSLCDPENNNCGCNYDGGACCGKTANYYYCNGGEGSANPGDGACKCLDPKFPKAETTPTGLCIIDRKNDKQSTADVTIHAVNDPNTKDVVETTECNFQCQEGYFDKDKGDQKILFECVPNPNRRDPLGQKESAPTGCKGVCVICVMAFSIAS